tara:strand:+ start:5762 stop:6154 length:393 start_codon:yes stop_codon:yes gene_type:complete
MLGFLLLSLAHADPQFTQLKEGDVAPFDGRLLNDEAIVKLSIEDKFKVQQCDLQIEYEKQKLKELNELNLQKTTIELNSQIKILNEKVSLRDERIKEIENLSKPLKPISYAAGGFLLGTATTISILYAVY